MIKTSNKVKHQMQDQYLENVKWGQTSWMWMCNAIGKSQSQKKSEKFVQIDLANERPWEAALEKYQRMLIPESLRKILERWRQTRCSSDDHAYRLKLGKCKGVAVLASCYRQFTPSKITWTPPASLANEYQPMPRTNFSTTVGCQIWLHPNLDHQHQDDNTSRWNLPAAAACINLCST